MTIQQPLTNAQKQALFRERKKEAGLVRVMVWVPAARADDMREAAKQMVEKTKIRGDNNGKA